MIGKDLLQELLKLSEEELLLPVYVYADHGQEYYQQNYFSIENTRSYEYCLEDYYVHEDDIDQLRSEYEEDGEELELLKFIAIS